MRIIAILVAVCAFAQTGFADTYVTEKSDCTVRQVWMHDEVISRVYFDCEDGKGAVLDIVPYYLVGAKALPYATWRHAKENDHVHCPAVGVKVRNSELPRPIELSQRYVHCYVLKTPPTSLSVEAQ